MEQQPPKQHRHIVAKIFLAIGLLDLVLTIVLLALGLPFSPTAVVRWGLWIVLPALFIAGVFDKQEE